VELDREDDSAVCLDGVDSRDKYRLGEGVFRQTYPVSNGLESSMKGWDQT